jgi:acyl-CoA synthetase (AMP-forming)/AMP-acid ligase II
MNSAGKWISSLQLEDLLLKHPGVTEAAVISVPDERWGERPFALVAHKPTRVSLLTEQDLACLSWRRWTKRALANSTRNSCVRSTRPASQPSTP